MNVCLINYSLLKYHKSVISLQSSRDARYTVDLLSFSKRDEHVGASELNATMRVASPVTRPIPLRVGLLHRPLLAEKEIKHEKFDLCARARGENGWGSVRRNPGIRKAYGAARRGGSERRLSVYRQKGKAHQWIDRYFVCHPRQVTPKTRKNIENQNKNSGSRTSS